MTRLADRDLTEESSSSGDFYDAHLRIMMGRLLTTVRRQVRGSDTLDERWADLLRRRNFLVHEFFREPVELFEAQEGRGLVLAELSRLVNDARLVGQEWNRLTFQLESGST